MNRASGIKSIIYLLFAVAFIIICSSTSLKAAGMSIGVNVWYADWKPAWQDGYQFIVPFAPVTQMPMSIPLKSNDF